MASQLAFVEAQALKLTAEERARLADRLLASLSNDSAIEEAWAVEIERRVEEIESGRAQLLPAAESIARALYEDSPTASSITSKVPSSG